MAWTRRISDLEASAYHTTDYPAVLTSPPDAPGTMIIAPLGPPPPPVSPLTHLRGPLVASTAQIDRRPWSAEATPIRNQFGGDHYDRNRFGWSCNLPVAAAKSYRPRTFDGREVRDGFILSFCSQEPSRRGDPLERAIDCDLARSAQPKIRVRMCAHAADG
jgi:hypothetical protein